MTRSHHFAATITWKGNREEGTLDYKGYTRDHEIAIAGKPVLFASSDQAFRGNPSKHTPEDLLVASLSGCHMLWYLHLCAMNGVVILAYTDHASGEMTENDDGSGQFTGVTLRTRVTVRDQAMVEKAGALHDDAHKMCFIARSVNFPLYHEVEIVFDTKVG